jgi:hypothetical protein
LTITLYLSLPLKRIGIWTGAFEQQPARKAQETVAELEELGYGAVWVSEATGREAFTQSALGPVVVFFVGDPMPVFIRRRH